ncbi:hypothetical protein GCM10023201_39300 [Actinomycetospora corticicola]|uniref:Uncharacterized protein n=1 Tax=Actinomycetospora corticicola TaxID=663602 RepID=A0A7Y9DZ91_9PSEU|nr:hypothetical protein [Actinomycetospora corticicola]NYD37967.1 hypothetical protein [Actinomycetospora corticicola]
MNAPFGSAEPQQPGHGVPPPGYGTPAPEPASVRTAFLLWCVALALYVIAQLLGVLFPPSAADYAAYFESLGLPPAAQQQAMANIGSATTIASVVGLVVTVVVAAVFLWFGLRVRAGANWARITTAILAGVGILFSLGGAVTSLVAPVPVAAGGVPSVLQLVTAVLLVGYLVLLFRKPSSEYFASRAVPR